MVYAALWLAWALMVLVPTRYLVLLAGLYEFTFRLLPEQVVENGGSGKGFGDGGLKFGVGEVADRPLDVSVCVSVWGGACVLCVPDSLCCVSKRLISYL